MKAELLEYFSRQITIPEIGSTGLDKLHSSTIAIAGAGGVGSSAAFYLAKSGIGKLRLIDQDIIEPSNLQRIHGATTTDLYHPKAEVISDRISEQVKGVSVDPIIETITRTNVDYLLSDANIVLDGLDNFRTRYILNRFAIRSRTPYMFVSAVSNQAHLTLLNPPATPCLDCIMPNVQDRFQDSCETLGVGPVTTGVAGALAANALVNYILGQSTKLSGELLTVDLTNPAFLFNKTSKRNDCNSCTNQTEDDSMGEPIVTSLCGEHTANVLPTHDLDLNLASMSRIVPTGRMVLHSKSVLVFRHGSHLVSVFPNGRLLISGVEKEAEASEVAREVWQVIRGN